MSPQLPTKVHCHLHVLLFSALLTYCSCLGVSSEVIKTGVQCMESEREALLQFKHSIRVDDCGLLDTWQDSIDCCQWRGIHCSNISGRVISLRLPGIDEDPDNDSYKPCLEGTLSDSLLELKHLEYLDLSLNNFGGHIPKFIGSLSNLEHLNLSYAGFDGVVPQEIGNLSRLSSLEINYDYFDSYMRVESLRWLSHLRLLKRLDLSYIDLSVAKNTWLPIVNSLPFLQVLRLDECQLSLKLPSSLSYINSSSTLNVVSLSDNNMNDTSIFEWMFKLKGLGSSLVYLDLSDNQMFGNNVQMSGRAVNFIGSLCSLQTLYLFDTNLYYDFSDIVQSFSVCPHKALTSLDLSLNQVWGSIPDNINTLSSLRKLDLSGNQLNGTISQALSMLETLDLSQNSLKGVVTEEHLSITFNGPTFIDLSSNNFHGAIPPFLRNVSILDLHNNSFSEGLVSFLCPQSKMPLQYLDLSNNLFSDKLPDCWGYFGNLVELHLENNNLWGSLPTSIGALDMLNELNLGNNSISGELPPSLNCKSLDILDLSHNSLTGYIPATFWDSFKNLNILTLQNNNFTGALPSSICHLSQIQILDLSSNRIFGTIPRCIYNFQGMVTGTTTTYVESRYDIDFSNNKLEGHIPEGISSLVGLVSINLSRNHLSGAIPLKIGQLTSLETLDLSHNHISGAIPTSLAKITFLEILDLSYNNLSGTIPTGPQLQTFDNSTYIGNPRLCGTPLQNCVGDNEGATIPQNKDNTTTSHSEHHVDDFMLGLYISVVLGLITGFWGVCGTLVIKRTWRHAFFRFFDDMKDKIYVVVVVRIARHWRRS